MKFAHLADCHIGAWRVPALRNLADEVFATAIQTCILEEVDFVVIAGDLFHTALPGVDHVRHVVKHLTLLRQRNIPVYIIAGSHDYSPTGKTMLSVLEEAGLVIDVFKGTVDNGVLTLKPVQDEKTGVWLTGVLGKAGQLDTELYTSLRVQEVSGIKIFLFHTTLDELKPARMSHVASESISMLPKGFDYYAGGHVHIVGSTSLPGYADVVYPGPLFPASFSELEELKGGGMYIVELAGSGAKKRRVDIHAREVMSINLDCSGKDPQEVAEDIASDLTNVDGKIVLVRLTGTLKQGAAADIPFSQLFLEAQKRGAICCLRNTVALRSPEFIEQEFTPKAAEKIEAEVIDEHLGQQPLGMTTEEERKLFHDLLSTLGQTQHEGENKNAYELRVLDDARKYL